MFDRFYIKIRSSTFQLKTITKNRFPLMLADYVNLF